MSEPRLDIIDVPDVPAPTAVLCWKQSRLMVRCDRAASHFGRHSWDHGDAEPLDPLLADTQINARIEQILQKFLHAEALTVGDTVFLFDLVRTLRACAEAPETDLMDVLNDLQSCVYNIECDCIDPPPDEKHDDYDAHSQYCRRYLWGYIEKLKTRRAEAPPPTDKGEVMTERLKNLCTCGNELFHEGNDYGACLTLLPDSLDRPMHTRISLLLARANNEARLAVALRQKLEEVAGPDVASSIV